MLFLAVFCGFLAEYQLEHTIEKGREVQYIKSMVADAENDVIANRQKAHGLDSLANLCFMFEDSDNTKKQLYRLYRTYAASSEIARFTDRTLSQLKNSGGMRLIRNKVAADSITFYDNQIKEVIGQQNVYSAFLNEAVIFSQQIFSWYYLQSDPDNRKLKSPSTLLLWLNY